MTRNFYRHLHKTSIMPPGPVVRHAPISGEAAANNLAENRLRPTKPGARDWMFFGHAAAGANFAFFSTLTPSIPPTPNLHKKYLN